MEIAKNFEWRPELSVQINDGLTQTSADGAALAFDKKYGIMFCAYMPGFQGNYGESRGKIALSYFPASQPTNIRFITVAEGEAVYVPNILSLGNGCVRVFYEKHSTSAGDHVFCFKDFDFLSGELTQEQAVQIKHPDGTLEPYNLSAKFRYLEAQGCHNHICVNTEQMGHCTYFTGEDGYTYGATVSFLSEVPLFRSADHGATIEFFAVYPKPAQYEFEYRFLNGKIYAIYRTNLAEDCIQFVSSDDGGKTWSEPVAYKGSIQCRPRMLVYNGHILTACNYFNPDTKHRPEIQQGRTSVRLYYGENPDGNKNLVVADMYSKCGMVNICLADIMNDLYLAYSTSELALEYQNGNPKVRGKDAIRYMKLGDLIPEEV